MKSKEFEDVCLERMADEFAAGRAKMNRYGVQCTIIGTSPLGEPIYRPLRSAPDFDITLPPEGLHAIVEAKVCSSASFPLHDEFFKVRQLKYMLEHATCGAVCGLLIHFPERVLVTKTVDEMTVLFPVHPAHPFWCEFELGDVKSINREDCDRYAAEVFWNKRAGQRKLRPDILSALRNLNVKGDMCIGNLLLWKQPLTEMEAADRPW